MKVIHFSGGRTSAYMTLKYYEEGDLVIFCDTGREHPKTYEFIDNFEKNENITVIRLKYKDSERPFEEFLKKECANARVPNATERRCTYHLKILTARRYLRKLGLYKYEQIIGFRYDEPLRVKRYIHKWKNVKTTFPLYEDFIHKQMILDFWKNKSYDLEIPSILGNCTLCFMKGKNSIIGILSQYPELAEEWIKDEEVTGKKYFVTVSMKKLLELGQNNLFKNNKIDLNDLEPSFNCACTS